MCRSDFISTFCYGIMAQAIRSEVDKQLIMYCSRIILNLARYNSTTANTFQEGGLVTIAQMLLRWCDKDCDIFNTLCTLIWIFAHCPVKRKVSVITLGCVFKRNEILLKFYFVLFVCFCQTLYANTNVFIFFVFVFRLYVIL